MPICCYCGTAAYILFLFFFWQKLPTFCCALAENHSKLSLGANTETLLVSRSGSTMRLRKEQIGSLTGWVQGDPPHYSGPSSRLRILKQKSAWILKSWIFISLFSLSILLSFEHESSTNEFERRKKIGLVKKRVEPCPIFPVYTIFLVNEELIGKQAQYLCLYPILLSWVPVYTFSKSTE